MKKVSSYYCAKGLSLMLTCKNIVVKINDEFLQLTGYEHSCFINKSVDEVFDMLKLNKLSNQRWFLYTKSMIFKEVDLNIKENPTKESKMYFLAEKNDLDIEYNFKNISKIYEGTATGIAIFSIPDFILLKANQQYLNFLLPPYREYQAAYSKNLDELCFSGNKSSVVEAINNSIRSLNPVHLKEIKLSHSEGDIYFDIDITPMIINGVAEYIVFKATNVTEKVHYKNTANERALVFNCLALPVVRVSYPNLEIIEANENAVKSLSKLSGLSDLSITNIQDLTLYNFLSANTISQYQKLIDEMINSKGSVQINRYEIQQGSQKYHYNFIFQPVFDDNSNLDEFIITFIDVTEEVEQELALKKTLKMKDDFLSFMSHEFKTPLTVIYSAVQAIEYLHKNELSNKSIKFINKIHQNTLRQLRLVNNLLDITRSEAGYLKIHKLNADIIGMSKAIVDSVAIYAEEKNIEIVFDTCYESKIIAIDDEKFERIMLNLLSNAIKFTPSGKKINVTISSLEEKICIEITDEGVGIPPEKLSIIFDRFGQVDSSLTRNSEGTGIGLYLVKMLTLALGGDIVVESTEGKGSTFKVILEDSLVYEEKEETIMTTPSDSRLIQTVAIEFSDIYSLL